jgi:hypothetical protein
VKLDDKADKWRIQDYHVYAVACGELYGESGLGYHCEVDLWVTGLSGGRRWDVDHIPSGRRIASFTGQARARVFIEEIAGYTDWTKPVEELKEQDGLWQRVHKALDAATKWQPKEAKKLLQLRKQVDLWNEDDHA